MPSLRCLLSVAIGASSLLQLSAAAPVDACVITYTTSTYVLPPTVDSSTISPDPPASSDPPAQSTPATSDGVVGAISSTATSADPTIPTTAALFTPTQSDKPPTQPSNGGGTELPAPTATFQYATVGRGVQNYTCSAVGAVPLAIGAIATLYDLTLLAESSEATLDNVPPTVVYTPLSSFNGIDLTVEGDMTFPVIGHHYFTAAGVPTFDLNTRSKILFSKKVASIPAPASANVGPDGTGAVPWLKLVDAGSSVGLSEVYRIVTAGGKAPATCADTNPISVQYAAEYWFYG